MLNVMAFLVLILLNLATAGFNLTTAEFNLTTAEFNLATAELNLATAKKVVQHKNAIKL